ncbi:lysophospholipid acyltransferase family protein [Halothermothrix orenii]|uniref:lysophospholipid acyltransferase family protein n=1 Tax=Halothermothrix orenii TaxID=31909 RepID=UPI0002E6A48C|nr:lysophospholipid acyltransferase family protein [Halothermothrix orenii]
MKNIILYLVFEGFLLFIRILPGFLRQMVGLFFGKVLYYLPGNRKKVAYNNLKMAFDDLSDDRIKEIIRKVYINLGFMLVEYALTPGLNKDNMTKHIELEGEEHLKKAFDRGKGVIVYGAHFGNWEWMGIAISLMGYPMAAIVQEQNNSYFDRRINQMRQQKGVETIQRGMSVRKAFKALKEGKCLLILGDQDARSRGWRLKFFGKTASTFPGAVQLARRTGALIVPAFMVRKSRGKHRLKFYRPIEIGAEASMEEQKEFLQELNHITESVIKKYPDHWLWLHRRWKTY